MKGYEYFGKTLYIYSICALYISLDCFHISRDKEKVEKMVTSLGIKVMPRDLKHSDPKAPQCHLWPVASCVSSRALYPLPHKHWLLLKNTTIQGFFSIQVFFFYVFEKSLLCSKRVHLFAQNIVKIVLF